MQNRPFGSTGIRVSELCLGGMTFGAESDETTSLALVDEFLSAGGNFIDTADVYNDGRSEEILGKALQGRRDRVVVATKFRLRSGPGTNDVGASRRHIRLSVEQSLRRLRTDWIDLFQIHAWDPATPLEETLSTLDDLVRAGLVRYLGASQYTGWQIAYAIGRAQLYGWEPFVSLQPQYSLVSRGSELDLLPFARFSGLAVMPWSPLGGGLLTGKYAGAAPPEQSRGAEGLAAAWLVHASLEGRGPAIAAAVRSVADQIGRTPAQVALNWVLHRPGVTAPIVGARNVDQLKDNLGSTGWKLDTEHVSALNAVSDFERPHPHDIASSFHIDVH